MERLLEFGLNHWELVLLFLVLLSAVVVTEMRRGGQTISSAQLTQLINRDGALVLDVREANEYKEGHITGSVNIPFSAINERVSEIKKHQDKPVVIVCKMGQHSSSVGKTLKTKGFEDIRRLRGGVGGWQADSLPLVKGA